ncbi:hypothetical protein NE237_004032 [Protea cynaroides]|uniref:Uncharacterized protein n=1 Tax=Protea cynaroides TaxID=273540 RepID=A0A9Q0QT56_9MAGN|nr:hypothetical protein NE237_004032 [Protea cynaroides]
MDEDIGNSHKIIVDSFHDDKVIHARVGNLNKKRKLENEPSSFPLSKHKFSYQYEQSLAKESDDKEISKGKRVAEFTHNKTELKSAKDSNSFDPGNAENENTVVHEYRPQTCNSAQSSISSDSCNNKSLSDTLCFSDRGSIKDPNYFGKEQQEIVTGVAESNLPDVKGQLQFGKVEDKQLEDGLHYSLDEGELESMILYSNGPSEIVPHSERWIINQEEQQGPGGPTIDQEFEQYFSTLLL